MSFTSIKSLTLCLIIGYHFQCTSQEYIEDTARNNNKESPGDMFTSTSNLIQLMDFERISIGIVRNHLASQRYILDGLKYHRKAIEEGLTEKEHYNGLDHPLNAFRLVNRFVAHWKTVYNSVYNYTGHMLIRDQLYNGLVNMMPQFSDYHGSYKSLLRLQITYLLKPKDMAQGDIHGLMSEPMDQTDCFNMALTAIQMDDMEEIALEWLALAGERAETEEEQEGILEDVEEFRSRVQRLGNEKMTDVITDYLMDAVGYADEAESFRNPSSENDDDFEQFDDIPSKSMNNLKAEVEQFQHEYARNVEDDSNADTDVLHDVEEADEVGDEGFVPGELHIAQYTSDIEAEHEEIDEYKRQADAFAIREEVHSERQSIMSALGGDDEDSDIRIDDEEESREDPDSPFLNTPADTAQPQCGGGDSTPQILSEREITYNNVGGIGGRVLKIKYQGKEISEEELDDIQNLAVDSMVKDAGSGNDQMMNQQTNFYSLCRGEETKQRDTSVLFCRYRPTRITYMPWKEEIVSKDPFVSVIYDILLDNEIDHMKKQAKNKLMRAMAGATYIEGRVQSSSWHDERNDTIFAGITTKVGHITGLNVKEWAEIWQIGQYGIGGHYSNHYDFNANRFNKNKIRDKIMGDRLATFMIYLNDVNAGGYTVFPHLGLHIKPRKGMAIFWYNYERNGRPDNRMLHAACPVLIGHKWVANKWIHEFGNEFNRPCGKAMASRDL